MADFQVKVTGADVLARTLANGATMARYAFLSAGAQAVAILRGTIGMFQSRGRDSVRLNS